MSESIRDLRARARADLHGAFRVPAVYIAPDEAETVCSIRVHHRLPMLGNRPAAETGYGAQRAEDVPQVVVLAAEVSPVRGGVFSVAVGEAYEVLHVLPVEGITQTCQVGRMSETEATDLTVPE